MAHTYMQGKKQKSIKGDPGNSLAIQWLGLHALSAEGLGLISGKGTKNPTTCMVQPINK